MALLVVNMEFWNDVATDKSWRVLIRIGKKFSFVIIGGWACYLLTKAIKSKDIDIIADFDTLEKIRQEFPVKKTDFLRKYEAMIEGISVDIYVPHYSRFPLTAEEITRTGREIEGLRVPRPEVLIILKQQAEMDRAHSPKGQKDRVDIMNLLINSDPDLSEYNRLVKRHGLDGYRKRLLQIITESKKEFEYLGIADPGKARRIKKKLIGELR